MIACIPNKEWCSFFENIDLKHIFFYLFLSHTHTYREREVGKKREREKKTERVVVNVVIEMIIQLLGVGSLLLFLYGFQRLNSGHQTYVTNSLLPETSHPPFIFLV